MKKIATTGFFIDRSLLRSHQMVRYTTPGEWQGVILTTDTGSYQFPVAMPYHLKKVYMLAVSKTSVWASRGLIGSL